ncbi:MAG: hypothetical protein PHE78_02205 [Candidatus Gastranaerophilales bacterium]|nr:hypothetical protein [Candidatus Gastranaerophilales bacterium]
MTQSISNDSILKTDSISVQSSRKTTQKDSDEFASILEDVQNKTNEAEQTLLGEADNSKEKQDHDALVKEFQNISSGISVCGKCGAIFMGQGVQICSKCGHDMKEDKTTETESSSNTDQNSVSTKESIGQTSDLTGTATSKN